MSVIWIASYPRSGNTFFRNILYHVYGIDSYENEDRIDFDLEKSSEINFIKAHDLPFQLKKYNRKKHTVIYLVRDGRDAICSTAFKRKNLIDGNSDIYTNFKDATRATRGSHFGGWGNNCRLWIKEEPILIRFEDLIKEPKKIFTQLEKELNLPEPNWDELPTFETQKTGNVRHGREGDNNTNEANFSEKFFRKGEVGNWKTEMPEEFQTLYWKKYAAMMEAFGYSEDGKINPVDHARLTAIKQMTLKNSKVKAVLYYWHIRAKISKIKNNILNK